MLRVIRPITITSGMLVSHSEPDSALPAWAAGTTYTVGATVQHLHWEFESAQGANTGNVPDPTKSTDWWLRTGPANRWAMFDGSVGTETVAASTTLQVALQPGEFITGLGLAAATGAEVRVQMVSGSTTVYDQTQPINSGSAPNPYDWCFGDRDESGDVVFRDLPPFLDGVVTVTISGGASASCGVLTLGRIYDVGTEVLSGVQAGIRSYSRKDTDDFGVKLLPRRSSKTVSLPITLSRRDFRFTHKLLSDLDGVACMWSGDENTDISGPLQVYGFLVSFRIVAEFRDFLRLSVDIEGLT